MNNLQCLLASYIHDVSKHKVKVSNETLIQIKSLDYHQLAYVLNQFIPDIELTQCNASEHIIISSNEDAYVCSSSTYKDYPIHIKLYTDTTEMIAIVPEQLFNSMVCFTTKKPMFVPVIAEQVCSMNRTRKLHQMTLVFDTTKHHVFLHDPNSRSLFNNDETLSLIQRYVTSFNTILRDYGMKCYTFIQYDFDFMNININFLFNNSITGNCVIASIVFIILYNNLQDASYIELLLQTTKKDEYKKVYVAFYNKLQEYLKLSM